ncbi:MAG: nucleoside recognition domain-containing protein [Eubacterium sp.]|nr:nucleoside recognition domain-containing protein [Eubacterium sp.]
MITKKFLNKKKGVARFICFSLIGIFLFFIQIPFSEGKKIPIDIFITIIRRTFNDYLPYFVLLIGFLGMIDVFFIKKNFKESKTAIIMAICKAVGFLMIVMSVLKIGPSFLIKPEIGPYTVDLLGGPVGITILVGSLFLPLLLEYGLADALGVLLRPIMRPIFKIPGRTAIVAITAFFGNFALGHIGIEKMYKQGQCTGKESAIVGTGFATASIVTFMVFANMVDIMDQWNQYFILTVISTFGITAITCRIYPLSNIKNTYYPDIQPNPEPEYKTNILKNTFCEGIKSAETAPPLLKNIILQFNETLFVLGGLFTSGMFFMAGALIIKDHTNIFTWIGCLFWPFLSIVRIPDMSIAIDACGISILDSMLTTSVGANALQEGLPLAMTTRYFLAILPISMIVFFSGFIPCILSTEIPIKLHELVILWFIRVTLTIFIVGIYGLLFL